MSRSMLSRLATFLAVACPLILVASSARAVVWQIGPNLGMDVFSVAGDAAAGIGVPEGTDPLVGALRPSLRFGAWSDDQRHEVYLDTGAMLITSESTYTNFIATLNYSHAFRWGSAPYVTAGFGIANRGSLGESRQALSFAVGLGRRQRLGHGHGAVRYEARYERLQERDVPADNPPLDIIGVRIGFDLDLNEPAKQKEWSAQAW